MVLPQPEGPRRAKNSFSRMSSEIAVDGGRAPETLGDAVDGEQRARRGHGAIVPRLRRCERASAVTLTAMTMVASALISGVTPKRIIA